jgi:hypothetical protein
VIMAGPSSPSGDVSHRAPPGHTSDQKVEILRHHMVDKLPVSETCNDLGTIATLSAGSGAAVVRMKPQCPSGEPRAAH